jgi:hypothetical protein
VPVSHASSALPRSYSSSKSGGGGGGSSSNSNSIHNSQTSTSSSLVNFNLSTIFPEINIASGQGGQVNCQVKENGHLIKNWFIESVRVD